MKDIVDKQQASTAKNLVSHEDDKDAVIKKRLQNLKEKPGFNQHKEYFWKTTTSVQLKYNLLF